MADQSSIWRHMLSAFDRAQVPPKYAAEIARIKSFGPYFVLPGPRRRPDYVRSEETYYGGEDLSAVEEGLNSRHLEDYEYELCLGSMETVASAGISCAVLIKERLIALGENRPINFFISATEYENEPEMWPVYFTFSRARGPGHDLPPLDTDDYDANRNPAYFEIRLRL